MAQSMLQKPSKSKWEIGDLCEVYNRSKKEWIQGEITNVFKDDDGTWVRVESNGRINDLMEDDPDIRSINAISQSLVHLVISEMAKMCRYYYLL